MITEQDYCPMNGDTPGEPPIRTIEWTIVQPMFSLPACITDSQIDHFVRVTKLHSWKRLPDGQVVIYGKVSGRIEVAVMGHA